MKNWDTVAIIGVGLLGGSIGLALQQRGLVRRVIGVGRREESLRRARLLGTVTDTTLELARGVAEADLIVVCTPVGDIVDYVCQAAEHCPAHAIITDVGSTKADIVRQLRQQLPTELRFVGSHPLAGSEKTGAQHAQAELFEGRVTVVTSAEGTESGALEQVVAFWESLGSRVLRMSPEDHDEAVAMTSHATHVIAAALAAATAPDQLPLTASGWRDTTRVAAGDPQLWRQILVTNRDQVLKSLGKFEKVLSQFRAALKRGDDASLVQLLDAGKKTRDSVGS